MGLGLCCSFPAKRQAKDQAAPSRRQNIPPEDHRRGSESPSLTPWPGALPPVNFTPSPFARSPFASSPVAPSSVVLSPTPPPDRFGLVSPFRRPSSTVPPSPRFLARDASRFSSFDTVPLGRSSPRPALYTEVALVARDIWEEAYDEVSRDEVLRPLVKNYEELYNNITAGSSFGSRRPSLAQKEPLSDDDEHSIRPGDEQFARLGQEYLEVARKDAANQGIVSSAVQFIQKTRDVIGIALASSPPASLAWTGICTIVLPVSLRPSSLTSR